MSQMSTEERLVYMANQIARNFAIAGDDKAILATADHIASFWDPSMRQRIFSLAANDGHGLQPIAAQAVNYLQILGAPDHHVPITAFGDARHSGALDSG